MTGCATPALVWHLQVWQRVWRRGSDRRDWHGFLVPSLPRVSPVVLEGVLGLCVYVRRMQICKVPEVVKPYGYNGVWKWTHFCV